jgi:hypothetical protein
MITFRKFVTTLIAEAEAPAAAGAATPPAAPTPDAGAAPASPVPDLGGLGGGGGLGGAFSPPAGDLGGLGSSPMGAPDAGLGGATAQQSPIASLVNTNVWDALDNYFKSQDKKLNK